MEGLGLSQGEQQTGTTYSQVPGNLCGRVASLLHRQPVWGDVGAERAQPNVGDVSLQNFYLAADARRPVFAGSYAAAGRTQTLFFVALWAGNTLF